jgi:hypothetical protein
MTREALSHPVAIAGVLVTTASAVLFIALMIAMLAGLEANPYAGLVVFVAIPAAFVAGLVLIPIGIWLRHRQLRRHPDVVADWPVVDFRRVHVRRTVLLVTALTAVNIVIVLVAGYGSLHWMESPVFCGQVCHTPMRPQFTAWGNGPHARIACVTCHIGGGPGAFVHAKLSGVRQLMHVATNSYSRPIPPGAEMPAGSQAQTCGTCHETRRAVGDRIHVIREYGDDEANTETTTVLQMNMGGASSPARRIHWHADPGIRIEYVATDAERQTIALVKVTDANGRVKEFVAPDTTEEKLRQGSRHTMDCIDCHNTIGHPMSPTPEAAVDRAIAAGRVSRDLPHVRREGVRLVKAAYPTEDAAAQAIDQGLRSFYQSRGGAVDAQALARTVAGVQEVYRRNVFPAMKVSWGAYPTNAGHVTSNGCFRCHDESHKAKDGMAISGDCGYCHRQIEGNPE